jgi:hypothetical protein
MLALSLLRDKARAEVARRKARRRFRPEDLCRRGKRLATAQLAFIRDKSRWKVACCSRRAGKTVACAILLLQSALEHEGSLNLYVTLTRKSGKRIVWKRLLQLNREYGLGGEPNRSELTLTFPNGSVIEVGGAKDETEIEKYRGPAWQLVVLDEAQSFKEYIQEFVDDVVIPTLIETKGSMVMIGTPAKIRAGYFYEAVQHAPPALRDLMNVSPPANDNAEDEDGGGRVVGWSVHHWTIVDNPFIDDVPAELAGIRKRKVWSQQHPTYLREYLGRWVAEHDALVYKYDQERNGYAVAPDFMGDLEFKCVLVVDQGFHDADALGALWFRKGKPGVWLEERHHARKQSAGQLAAVAKEHWTALKGRCIRFGWDEGGGGKKVAEDVRIAGIPVEPVDKMGKIAGIEDTNTALVSGCLKVPAVGHAASDAAKVTWDPKARGVKLSERYHTDIWDCVNYGLRWLVGLVPLNQPAELPLPVDDVERMRQEAVRRAVERQKKSTKKDWVKAALARK